MPADQQKRLTADEQVAVKRAIDDIYGAIRYADWDQSAEDSVATIHRLTGLTMDGTMPDLYGFLGAAKRVLRDHQTV